MFLPDNKSLIDRACSVKMAGYQLRSLFVVQFDRMAIQEMIISISVCVLRFICCLDLIYFFLLIFTYVSRHVFQIVSYYFLHNFFSHTAAGRSDTGSERRLQDIVARRKLVDLAKAQAQEVAVLRAEVERLRMRTFPALVQIEHQDFVCAVNMKRRSERAVNTRLFVCNI